MIQKYFHLIKSKFMYTCVIAILVLSSVTLVGCKSKKKIALKNIERAADDYRLSLRVNPEASDSNYAILTNKLQTNIGVLAEESSGGTKEMYVLLQDFLSKTEKVAIGWQNALNKVQEERILDFNLLNDQKEFDYQIETLQTYIDRSKDYRLLVVNHVGYLKEKMNKIKLDSDFVTSFMKGLIEKSEEQRPTLEPLIDAHIQYGTVLKDILKVLESEQGKWTFEDEMVLFDNEKKIDEYNELIDEMLELEDTINTLGERLIQVL